MKALLIPVALVVLAACQPRVVEPTINPGGQPNYNQGTYGQAPLQQPVFDAEGNPVFDQYGQQVYADVPNATGAIQDNPNEIVLSNFSQEQQKRDREAYAAQQAAIAAQRVEVTNVTIAQTSSVNVAAYARQSTNSLGQRVYARAGKRGSCSGYGSNDAAQRAFLERGGPVNDPLGLDPDGDGFACKFDPSVYRTLRF